MRGEHEALPAQHHQHRPHHREVLRTNAVCPGSILQLLSQPQYLPPSVGSLAALSVRALSGRDLQGHVASQSAVSREGVKNRTANSRKLQGWLFLFFTLSSCFFLLFLSFFTAKRGTDICRVQGIERIKLSLFLSSLLYIYQLAPAVEFSAAAEVSRPSLLSSVQAKKQTNLPPPAEISTTTTTMRASILPPIIHWETPYKLNRTRKITAQEFDIHKRAITQLYITEDLELDEVRRIMTQRYRFYGR